MRARIIEAASLVLRREGLDSVSIPKLMKSAGLTHGGFYVHFRDRDDLIASAVEHAASSSIFSSDEPAPEVFNSYLSQAHVSHPEHGCVVAALGADGPRQAEPVRRFFAEIAGRFLRLIEKKLRPKARSQEVSDEALETAARIVGAIILARLVRDHTLAKQILSAARKSNTR